MCMNPGHYLGVGPKRTEKSKDNHRGSQGGNLDFKPMKLTPKGFTKRAWKKTV